MIIFPKRELIFKEMAFPNRGRPFVQGWAIWVLGLTKLKEYAKLQLTENEMHTSQIISLFIF
ncbi:hypothetical protein D7X33_14500 [Butyricicoccus sp. 1XD8-22]|nr:hypothetical protein D7X33_14500 [Butyricicoccus sp. 1XD8-22]